MQIVIVGGLPCSGKSKFAERLRQRWKRPLLSKDVIKESLFDSLGAADRAWSRRLSRAAYDIQFGQAAELLGCGMEFILEGNFREADHRDRFAALAERGASLLQVHCFAAAHVLIERFRERVDSNARHAGHADRESFPEIAGEIRSSRQAPLTLDCRVVLCDTTSDWSNAIDASVTATLALLDADDRSPRAGPGRAKLC